MGYRSNSIVISRDMGHYVFDQCWKSREWRQQEWKWQSKAVRSTRWPAGDAASQRPCTPICRLAAVHSLGLPGLHPKAFYSPSPLLLSFVMLQAEKTPPEVKTYTCLSYKGQHGKCDTIVFWERALARKRFPNFPVPLTQILKWN